MKLISKDIETKIKWSLIYEPTLNTPIHQEYGLDYSTEVHDNNIAVYRWRSTIKRFIRESMYPNYFLIPRKYL